MYDTAMKILWVLPMLALFLSAIGSIAMNFYLMRYRAHIMKIILEEPADQVAGF